MTTTNVMIVDEVPEDDGTCAGCYLLPAVLDDDPDDHPATATWTWDDTADPIHEAWFTSREKAAAYAAARRWVVQG